MSHCPDYLDNELIHHFINVVKSVRAPILFHQIYTEALFFNSVLPLSGLRSPDRFDNVVDQFIIQLSWTVGHLFPIAGNSMRYNPVAQYS